MDFKVGLFFVSAFFVLLFNWACIIVIEKLNIEKRLYDSYVDNGFERIKCVNNNWMTLSYSITGLDLYYFTDSEDNVITCNDNLDFDSNKKVCGLKGEYNTDYNSCSIFLFSLIGLL